MADVAAPAPEEPSEAPQEEEPPKPKRDPRRKLVCRHWIRPTFLNYHYIYDYRHNYYDDVIDFMDRRQRGLERELPKPQTWAERALRTYTFKPNKDQYTYYTSFRKEEEHCYKVAHTYRPDHAKDFFYRKFKSVLF